MFKNKKSVFLISFFLFLFLFLMSCKEIPTSPDALDPWMFGGEIEIMYVRVKEVVDPRGSDPQGAVIYHYKYGGKNSSLFVPAGENTWIASVSLNCEPQPYYIWTVDMTVTTIYTSVGEKFFLRPKKEGAQWVELTCIVASPSKSGGEAAKFIFYNGQIQNPNPCF